MKIGLNGAELRQFGELLIKANKIQVKHLLLLVQDQHDRQWKVRSTTCPEVKR